MGTKPQKVEPYTNVSEAWEDIETLKSFVIGMQKGVRESNKMATTHVAYAGGTRTLDQMLSYMKDDLDLILVKLDLYLND